MRDINSKKGVRQPLVCCSSLENFSYIILCNIPQTAFRQTAIRQPSSRSGFPHSLACLLNMTSPGSCDFTSDIPRMRQRNSEESAIDSIMRNQTINKFSTLHDLFSHIIKKQMTEMKENSHFLFLTFLF